MTGFFYPLIVVGLVSTVIFSFKSRQDLWPRFFYLIDRYVLYNYDLFDERKGRSFSALCLWITSSQSHISATASPPVVLASSPSWTQDQISSSLPITLLIFPRYRSHRTFRYRKFFFILAYLYNKGTHFYGTIAYQRPTLLSVLFCL